jgi:hypothetical protein
VAEVEKLLYVRKKETSLPPSGGNRR